MGVSVVEQNRTVSISEDGNTVSVQEQALTVTVEQVVQSVNVQEVSRSVSVSTGSHAQNTDTGTTSDTFDINSDAAQHVKLKDLSNVNYTILEIRNKDDSGYADVYVNLLWSNESLYVGRVNLGSAGLYDGIALINSTAATLLSQIQNSPGLRFAGHAWDVDGGFDRLVNIAVLGKPIPGNTVGMKLSFLYGAGALPSTEFLVIYDTGILEIAQIKTDTVNEKTSAAGVTVDGVLIKDGSVDGVDVSVLNSNLSSLTATVDSLIPNNLPKQQGYWASSSSGPKAFTVDSAGNFYMVVRYTVRSSLAATTTAFQLYKSTNAGLTWIKHGSSKKIGNQIVGSPGLVCDSNGDVFMLYMRSDGSYTQLHCLFFDVSGETWGAEEQITSEAYTVGLHYDLTLDSSDVWHLAYGQKTASSTTSARLRYITRTAGPLGVWDAAPVDVGNNNTNPSNVRIVVDSNKKPVIVWNDATAFKTTASTNRGGAWASYQHANLYANGNDICIVNDVPYFSAATALCTFNADNSFTDISNASFNLAAANCAQLITDGVNIYIMDSTPSSAVRHYCSKYQIGVGHVDDFQCVDDITINTTDYTQCVLVESGGNPISSNYLYALVKTTYGYRQVEITGEGDG